LSLKGAYSQNALYTRDDVNLIIKYAKERGIRIVIEFDIPGHSSFGRAYPEIVGCPEYYNHPYVYQKQSVALDPTVDLTFEILGHFLREFDQVFPDAFMHLGGDEVRHHCWEQKDSIKEFMDNNGIANYTELERYFWGRLQREVFPTLQKTIILWDDAFVNDVPIDADSLVHIWQEEEYMIRAIKAGHRVVRSRGWYLDQAVPGAYRYRWLETWIDFYMLEPVPANLTPQEEALVLGGQACMWTEQVDHYTFDAIVWPRASAAGERLWSPKYINNSTEAGYRLMDHRCRLHLRNIDASPIFPDYCERDFMIPQKYKQEEQEIKEREFGQAENEIKEREFDKEEEKEIQLKEDQDEGEFQRVRIQKIFGRIQEESSEEPVLTFQIITVERDFQFKSKFENEKEQTPELDNQGNKEERNEKPAMFASSFSNLASLSDNPIALLLGGGFVLGAIFMAFLCLLLIYWRLILFCLVSSWLELLVPRSGAVTYGLTWIY